MPGNTGAMNTQQPAAQLGAAIDALGRDLALYGTGRQEHELPSGAQLRALFTGGLQLVSALRRAFANTEDPRLALEMAMCAQQLSFEATRMELAAADRTSATAAHTLAQSELDQLRGAPADTEQPAERATGRTSYKNPAELLAAWTGRTYGSMHRTLLDAQDLIGRRSPSGAQLPPRFPHLAKKFQDPDADPCTVRLVSAKLAKAEPKDRTFEGVSTEATLRHADGRTLDEHAAAAVENEFTAAAALKAVANLITDAAHQGGQDGQDDPPPRIRRGLFPLPVTNPYERRYLLCVSALEGALIDSFRAHASNPRTQAGQAARKNPDSARPDAAHPGAASREDQAPANGADDSAGSFQEGSILDLLPEGEGTRWNDDDEFVDEAAPAERAVNGLLDLLQYEYFENFSYPRQDPPPDENPARNRRRIRPQLIAHLQIDDLRNIAAAHAETQNGVALPPAALRRMLCDAELIPAVFNSKGALLDYGRAVRLVPEAVQKAVLARDRRCIVPGCTAAVEQLQFHHIKPFSQGGSTSAGNTVPGCGTHHMEMDLGLIKVFWVQGLPWVLLPRDRDPQQLLRRNYCPDGVPKHIAPPQG